MKCAAASGELIFYCLSKRARKVDLPIGYELQIFRPKLWRLKMHKQGPLPLYLFWYASSVGRYSIYYVRFLGKIIHYSVVLPRNFRFRFMQAEDLHIGPCWTDAAHRGKHIYSATLSQIAQHNIGRKMWMFTNENNLASQRGIERVGFEKIGTGERVGLFKGYQLTPIARRSKEQA